MDPEADSCDTGNACKAMQYCQRLSQTPQLPGLSEATELLKARPMPFQKNAAARMVDILHNHSRVFLSDEAGLGKTYSTAAAVCKLAKEKWS